MTVLSLFSGCGGLDLGAIRAGLNIKTAYELDAIACETYPKVTGHSRIEQCDLTRLGLSQLPDCEAIIGGPPCVEFSEAGRRAGKDGARNLWPVAIDAVRVKRPTWFVFENVRNFIQGKNRAYFDSVLWEFRDMGYTVDWRLLNAADYGVPQTRERVIIVGWRDSRPFWRWPETTHGIKTGFYWQKWIGLGAALKEWLTGDLEPSPLPEWILRKYPNGLPESAFFAGQTSGLTKNYRLFDEPALTITAVHHTERIKIGWQCWKVDSHALALLQTLPEWLDNRRLIGNAVPPVLAEAIFSSGCT